MAFFDFKSLSFTYPEASRLALDGVDFSLQAGEFIVVCGRSGCGKSTLLRHFKTSLTPHGKRSGRVEFRGKPLDETDLRTQTQGIGFVQQSPENQLVTDKVWHELAFGLESLGMDPQTMRLRVAEMASFFGIGEWYHRDVQTLSGGQKQILNLASVMAMQPELLVLDEPTSMLDPIAAAEFLGILKKLNRELGTTILLSEHRLEEALPLADRAMVLDAGRISALETPAKLGFALQKAKNPMLLAMPAPTRIFLGLHADTQENHTCPVTVREGRRFIGAYMLQNPPQTAKLASPPAREAASAQECVVRLEDVWFRYEKQEPDVLCSLSLCVPKGGLYCVVGGNGAGKTTMLNVISKIARPRRGKVIIGGMSEKKAKQGEVAFKTALLPQNPQLLLLKKTVREDLLVSMPAGTSDSHKLALLDEMVKTVELTDLLDAHPYDISGGEQQRLALGKVLLSKPTLLLLDEPTKGLDSFFKHEFGRLLRGLLAGGTTILMVSHDIEFCAAYADRCALFFDGSIVAENDTRAFFAGNRFYTTATNRMCRHVLPQAITVKDVIHTWK